MGEFFKKEEGRKGKGEVICGWSCYRSFSPSLMFTVLVVFSFFSKRMGVLILMGFFLFLSLSLSVSLSVCAQCVVRGKDEVACAEFFWFKKARSEFKIKYKGM